MANKVSAGTVARTIILVLTLINTVLEYAGHPVLPISDDSIRELVGLIALIGSAVISWWKNNSFTPVAIYCDSMMKKIKKYK